MNKEIAIKVTDLHKNFKLPNEKNSSIKGAFINLFKGDRSYEVQNVLKGINFEVHKGDFFGIVGRNGSGKSTLLKLLAGIYSPDSGQIQVNGKLTPFIELGVGFSPELTGRENVFLNGALLGFSREEMNRMYDEIVEFAELGRFMDQKLKNYSSGMQVRLAFSIAIRAESDVLVLDEVLAVGDAAFQEKCRKVFESYKASGKTVILVTHEMSVVKQYCNKAFLLKAGKIVAKGDPTKVSNEYQKINESTLDLSNKTDNLRRQKNHRLKVSVTNETKTSRIKSGSDISVTVDYSRLSEEVQGVGVAIFKATGEYIFGANTHKDKLLSIPKNSITYTVNGNIGRGEYIIKAAAFGKSEDKVIEFVDDGPSFIIYQPSEKWEGLTKLKHEWRE